MSRVLLGLVVSGLERAGRALLLCAFVVACPIPARAAATTVPDTLRFAPLPADSQPNSTAREPLVVETEGGRPPSVDGLLADPGAWTLRHDRLSNVRLELDYNRVDPLRLGATYQVRRIAPMTPRVAGRIEYATGRGRVLYGAQLEQPFAPEGWLAVGVSMTRRTDHAPLQQVGDLENSLALLLGRQDYRDYFEREGFGGYVSSRLGGLATLSAHLRSDEFRSLPLRPHTGSLFHRGRELRDNPPIDEGRARTAILRLERRSDRSARARVGLYPWIDLEFAGGRLGGDFRYTRLLADVRSMIRPSPATLLALRFVGGTTRSGDLPAQSEFVLGGPDGLRAHQFGSFRGDQVALAQAEYTVALWHVRASGFEGGLHAIVFVDSGKAWNDPEHDWDVGAERMAADGGFGIGTAEDNLRVYFARNLQEAEPRFVISARLQRPF